VLFVREDGGDLVVGPFGEVYAFESRTLMGSCFAD